MSEDNKFETGSVRSADANHLRFDLISPIALLALARTYAEGAYKYGELNMELGMPVHDLLNHVLRHITMFLAGDRSEPHLPHALWGVGMAIHSDEMWPHLNRANLRDPGCKLSRDNIVKLDKGRAELAKRRRKNPQSPWSMDDLSEIQVLRAQREGAAVGTTD